MDEKVQQLVNTEARLMSLEAKTQHMEQRVQLVESGLRAEVDRAVAFDQELKEILNEIKNKNPITEFVTQNWKYIAIWIVVTTGGDVQTLVKIFFPNAGG